MFPIFSTFFRLLRRAQAERAPGTFGSHQGTPRAPHHHPLDSQKPLQTRSGFELDNVACTDTTLASCPNQLEVLGAWER